MNIDKLIGQNLKRIRQIEGISQEKLAEMINTPATRLSAYETGREGMGKDIMSRICEALNIKPAEFFFEKKEYSLTENAMILVEEIQQYGPDAIQKCREMCRIMFRPPEGAPISPIWPEIDRRSGENRRMDLIKRGNHE